MAIQARNRKNAHTDAPGEGWIAFGQVGKPHGLSGAFFLHTPDRRTAWDGYKKIQLEVEGGFAPIKVTKSYVSGGTLVLQLQELGDRTAVEAFAQARLFVHRSEIAVAEEEVLVADLQGLIVKDENGRTLGTVRRVVSFGAQDNLEIEVPGRKEPVLYPYLDAFVLNLDGAAKTITVRYEEAFFEGLEEGQVP
jgi:16S rRNA processing protein RimM